MRRTAIVRAASPALWLVSIVAALLSLALSTGSANGAIGYPGPIAEPGLPLGPSLGSIYINGRGTSGWVNGFDDNSAVCYTINGHEAGCGTTESGKRSPYAFFYLAAFSSDHTCPITAPIYAQVTFDPGAQTGPKIEVHVGVNTLRVIGTKTINGVVTQVGVALPFTVIDPCAPPPPTTTTTQRNGSTTTTQLGPITTTSTQPSGSTTSSSLPGPTSTTSSPAGGGTISPNIPYPSFDFNGQSPSSTAKFLTTAIFIVAAVAAAAAAAAAGGGGAVGKAPEPIEPVDEGGETSGSEVAGEQPVDEGGETSGSEVAGEQPVDEGGAEAGAGSGESGESGTSGSPQSANPVDDDE